MPPDHSAAQTSWTTVITAHSTLLPLHTNCTAARHIGIDTARCVHDPRDRQHTRHADACGVDPGQVGGCAGAKIDRAGVGLGRSVVNRALQAEEATGGPPLPCINWKTSIYYSSRPKRSSGVQVRACNGVGAVEVGVGFSPRGGGAPHAGAVVGGAARVEAATAAGAALAGGTPLTGNRGEDGVE